MIDAIVFDPAEPWLAARTLRALARQGVAATVANESDLASRVASAQGPVWLVRAGAWPFSPPAAVLAHATGRSVVALGATAESSDWQDVLSRTGGDLARATSWPRVDSAIAFDPASFADLVASAGTVDQAMKAAPRVVRAPSLDVGYHRALRIVLGVTTLHRGGAERVVLDLVAELRALGHDVLLAVLDRPGREPFPEPSGTIQLRDLARSRAERLDQLTRIAHERGADAIHVHLFDGDDVHRLCESDVPVVVTVHNSEPGWPASLARVATAKRPPLVVACSLGVARELDVAGLGLRTRTIWNGIVPVRAVVDRAAARSALGIEGDATVLLAIANHRPQKRLDRLPAILAAFGGDARLVLIGEPVSADPEALAIAGRVRAEAERLGVAERVIFAGSRGSMNDVYAAADVVVSASAFEGLSLVHLEAVAAGVPLVTTRVAGTEELAAKNEGISIVDVDATPEAFAEAIRRRSPAGTLAPDFRARTMAARHVELYARVAPATARGGVVIVTNNLSTGGAQSSARRLLIDLARQGIAGRAVVIEEQAAYPTPGRAALEAAGIPVDVAPRAGTVDASITARAVAEVVDRAAPDAVLFWNVTPEQKVLIADLLVGVAVWDVSPGEMYFASFERYLKSPRIGSPYLSLRDYGRLLRGAIVKYSGEQERASSLLGVPTHVVLNGMEVPEKPVRPAFGTRVGTLARIAPDKKLEELIEAVRLERFELVIAGAAERGSEDYAEALRKSTTDLPITWAGERNALEFLSEIDLFAMISEPAGCPNALIEAMAAGLPIVATDHGAARELEAGVLVPRGDSAALGDRIVRLLDDPARRAKLGDEAHARARAHLSVARMAADYVRICGLRSCP